MGPTDIISNPAGSYKMLNATSGHDRIQQLGLLVCDHELDGTQRPGPTHFLAPNTTQFDENWATAAKNALSYACQVSLSDEYPADETSGTLLHGPVTASNVPALVGTTMQRNYTVVSRPDGVCLRLWLENVKEGYRWEI
ncbi:hypothetical protein MFIFM68171_07136 [Madurella fahalii]|uniref:Uncharacterized protein n=1 Tax=Madurella fahalii TaxID=1157608 RepID=A0ABQ0GGP0_9PEZI